MRTELEGKNEYSATGIQQWLQERFHPRMIAALFIFWLILAGSLAWEQLAIGLLSALVITVFWGDFLVSQREGFPLTWRRLLLLIRYFGDFCVELVRANIQVARIVLKPKMPISPCFVRYRLQLDKNISRVLLANSITLTPGTLTVFLEQQQIIVHALTEDGAFDVPDWRLEKELKQIEEG